MMIEARAKQIAKKPTEDSRDPVASSTTPMASGPTKPPRLPKQLMMPVPTTAISAVIIEEAIAQYGPDQL